jgi:general secretion pathway protein H
LSDEGGRTSAGFTLIELLVVLVLLAVLAAMVMPWLAGSVPRNALRVAGVELRAALAAARSDAIAAGRTVVFRSDQNGGYWVDAQHHQIATASDPALRLRITAGGGQLAFFPWGGSSGGRVRIEDRHGRADLIIDAATGRAVLQP